MKKILLIALLTILSTTSAFADGGYGHGGGHGGGRGGDEGWWIVPALIGGVLIYELTQQPQPVYVPPSGTYIEQTPPDYPPSNTQTNAPGVTSTAMQYLYFCVAANGYYPYVPSCPGGWQAVPTTPPDSLPSAPNAPPPP